MAASPSFKFEILTSCLPPIQLLAIPNSRTRKGRIAANMKRAAPWSDGDDDDYSSSDTDSSTLDTDSEDNKDSTKRNATKIESANKRKSKKGIDLEALKRHGYKGGLSVMGVPPPREPDDQKQDWSWSKGQESRAKETVETYADRQKTRSAILEGEQLLATARDKRELSFSQKEKRKRDIGQTSRGKSYVEEEKRLLRESGIYSGFDS